MDDSLEIPEGVPPPRIRPAVSPPPEAGIGGGSSDGHNHAVHGHGDDDWLQFVASERGGERRGSGSSDGIADGWTTRLGAVKQWGHAKLQWPDQQ